MGCFVALVDGIKRLIVDELTVSTNKEILEQRYQIIENDPVRPNGKPLLVYFPYAFPGETITVRKSNDKKSTVIYSCGGGKVTGLVLSVGSLGQTIKVFPVITSVRRDDNCLRNLLLSIMFDDHTELGKRSRHLVSRVLLDLSRGPGCNFNFVHSTLGRIKLYLNYKIKMIIVYVNNVKRLIPFELAHNLHL